MAHNLIRFRTDEAKKQRRRDQINAARHRRKVEGRGEFAGKPPSIKQAKLEMTEVRNGTPSPTRNVTLPYVSFLDPSKRHEWELDVAPPNRGRAAAVEAPGAEDVDPKSPAASAQQRVREDA